LGFGCGAHSTRGAVRWKNVSATEDYIGRVGQGASTRMDVRRSTAGERLGDALFTGLRLTAGIDMHAVQRGYGIDVWQRYGEELQPFITEGLLTREASVLRLTRRGMLLANEVMTVFV